MTAAQKQLADHPYYDQASWSILPVEVWAPSLTAITSRLAGAPRRVCEDTGRHRRRVRTRAAREDREGRTRRPGRHRRGQESHQAAVDALDVQIDAAKKNIDTSRSAFVASCQAAAAKVAPATRDEFAPAIVNLRRAVHEAKVANIAATARYPFLVVQTVQSPVGLKNELVTAAKGNLSDIVFERVGKRIRLSASAQVGVVYDNGKVDVSMNGVTTDDLAQLDVADVLSETISRDVGADPRQRRGHGDEQPGHRDESAGVPQVTA